MLADASAPFPEVVHGECLKRVGIASLAERELHDLYFNARSLAGVLPRLRTFCLFSGCSPDRIPEVDQLGRVGRKVDDPLAQLKRLQELTIRRRAEHAIPFYVRAILQVRKNAGLPPDGPLFPVTHTSGVGPNACGSLRMSSANRGDAPIGITRFATVFFLVFS